MNDWQEKADWLRGVHGTCAQWDSDGNLLSLTLGSEPVTHSTGNEDPAPQLTAEETERRMRQERQRVALASSGGPRRRLSANTD